LKSTAAVGAVGATNAFLARSAHAAGSDIIKVGLVGCGGRGNGAAKNAMTADPGCRLTAIAEVFYNRMEEGKKQLRKSLGDQYEVPDDQCFTGWEALEQILATDIDVILLATPPGFRPAQMEAAVNAGKHVFCENRCDRRDRFDPRELSHIDIVVEEPTTRLDAHASSSAQLALLQVVERRPYCRAVHPFVGQSHVVASRCATDQMLWKWWSTSPNVDGLR